VNYTKKNEVTGGWRKLHNQELHNLYSSLSIIRIIKSERVRWAGHVVRIGEILVGKSEGKRPHGRSRYRWHWGRFSPSTSVSPANFHSTNFSKNHPHLSSGVCTIGQKWPQYQGLEQIPRDSVRLHQ
jgi:hypothetical protein